MNVRTFFFNRDLVERVNHILQVDEIVNISSALKSRYQKAPPGIKRCLKLSMTDGVQRVFSMEYRPIKDLDVLAPAGLKVFVIV